MLKELNDHEFTLAVGIKDDFGDCVMCRLLALSEARALEAVAGHVETIAKQRVKIRVWRLATVACVVALMGCISLKGRA